MQDNLEKIKNIDPVVDAFRVELNEKIKKHFESKQVESLEENSDKLFAYKIFYESKGKEIVGYLIEPQTNKKNLPCIIWNRGGSRDFGSIKWGMLFNEKTMISPLAKQDYIVIASQYPGVEEGEGQDKMGSEDDIASILDLRKILKEYSRADEKRIGMFGHSRGGTMAYMCLREIDWIQATVVAGAATDEIKAPEFRDGWEKHQEKMYGGGREEKKRRSAIYWADEIDKETPILIMHGTADWRVNPKDSIRVSEKFYEYKVPYRLIMFEGNDHGLTESRREYKKQTLDWFERFLKNEEELPNLKPHGK